MAHCRDLTVVLRLVVLAFALLLLTALLLAFLLLMHLKPRPRLFLVPLEASKDGVIELIVCLLVGTTSVWAPPFVHWRSKGCRQVMLTFFLNCL